MNNVELPEEEVEENIIIEDTSDYLALSFNERMYRWKESIGLQPDIFVTDGHFFGSINHSSPIALEIVEAYLSEDERDLVEFIYGKGR